MAPRSVNCRRTISPPPAAILKMSSSASSRISPKRILCYGDSLTLGTSPPSFETFPFYGPHLKRTLNDGTRDAAGKIEAVLWRGMLG
ncbi:hypothetical protein ACHAWF_008213 [Thalassiosira exigua]